jgi:hypothetical protein
MKRAVFKSYANGYYTFTFEKGNDIDFEEIHPKALYRYDLKNDASFVDQTFELIFTEQIVDSEQDLVIYRIESLKLLNL